jgi:hypothetical protein
MIVVLNACFPQDRIAFLTLVARWFAICAFAATLLRNFASYSAALAGYTAAIIAADTLGATGGPDGQVFMLAVARASEICIGIVCAGIVLAGTDLGGSKRQLSGSRIEQPPPAHKRLHKLNLGIGRPFLIAAACYLPANSALCGIRGNVFVFLHRPVPPIGLLKPLHTERGLFQHPL